MANCTVFLVWIIVSTITCAKIIQKQTNEEREQFKVAHDQCQTDEKTFVDEKLIKNVFRGFFIEDDKLKTHMLCVAKSLVLINDNGKLNQHFIQSKWIEHYGEKEVEKLQECLKEKSTSVETSWDFFKCQHKAVQQ